jgi:bacillithiol system protein YtxJ
MKEITTLDELETILDESATTPVLFFKHSTQCPISAAAFEQFSEFLKSHPPVKAVLIKVIESRPVSNQLTQVTGIQHESPQALLMDNNEVKWHASHRTITKATLQQALMRVEDRS